MTEQLTKYAEEAFRVLRRPGEDNPHGLSLNVATTVGFHASRLGMTEKELSEWLQSAYGAVWVRQSNLNPGVDMKDVRAEVIRRFREKS